MRRDNIPGGYGRYAFKKNIFHERDGSKCSKGILKKYYCWRSERTHCIRNDCIRNDCMRNKCIIVLSICSNSQILDMSAFEQHHFLVGKRRPSWTEGNCGIVKNYIWCHPHVIPVISCVWHVSELCRLWVV